MKIAAGILTWNRISTGRTGLLDQTIRSLSDADYLIVADNGSTDGSDVKPGEFSRFLLSEERWRFLSFPHRPGFPPAHTCGYGMDKLAATLVQYPADVIILSNDDIHWKLDAVQRLRDLWEVNDQDTVIISGLVEPTFALPGREPWNKVFTVEHAGDETLWYRRSVPGGAWTFSPASYELIFPVSTFRGVDDVPTCERLVDQGWRVAAVDLAEHTGLGQSTWGNASHDRFIVQTVDEMKEEWL